MAELSISGLDEAIAYLERLESGAGAMMERMAIAGAEAAAEARRAEAEARNIRDSGAMIRGIKPKKPERTASGVRVQVYSQGKDKKGVRNATKEFLEHYGYKGRMGSHWVDKAEAKGALAAEEAELKIFDEMTGG